MSAELRRLWKTEDYWAVWLGLGIVFLALAVFWCGQHHRELGCYAGELE